MYKKLLRDFKLEYAGSSYACLRTPCTLYRALAEGGRLENMDYALNLCAIDSLPELPFQISCRFLATEELLSYSKVVIRIGEVDAPCVLSVGDVNVLEISDHAPVHYVEVREALVVGENVLTFAFSPLPKARKVSYTAEEISDRGIFGDVEIIGYHTTFIEGVKFHQKHENGKVCLHISCKTHEITDNIETVATIVSPSGRMYYCGLHQGEGELLISDPMLWFPHTQGKPNLYRVSLTMYVSGEPEDSYAVSLGLREIALSFGSPMGDGEFALTVGGVRFFACGAEYCSSSILPNAESEARFESLIRTYVRSNVNLLFVSEQNRHLPHAFYELCDRYGLLVMQDIPSPKDAANSEEATKIYLETLRVILSGISTHPSLALLRSHLTGEDSIREIPEIIAEEAPDAVYTNVFIPRGQPVHLMDTTTAFATLSSPSSIPALHSLARFVPAEEQNPFSRVMETRATSPIPAFLTKASERYPYAMSMAQVVYLSQLSQSDAVREGVEYLRLRRGRAMGVILEATSDPLGRISPSIADAYGKEKAVVHTLHEVYAPVAILLRRDGYRVNFYVSNETQAPFAGTLLYRLLDARNRVLREERAEIVVTQDTLSLVASSDFSTLAHRRETEVFVEATLLYGESELVSSTILFTEPKRFLYQDPMMDKTITESGSEYILTLTPHAFAHRVYLDFSDTDATFSRNFFDLTKNVPVRIPFRVKDKKTSVDSLLHKLRVLCVYDIGK
ncbi:MAG: hypothetical protein IKC72_04750 [Clostridia bacterium]|nr:hypothetical protein [Clostridia bacterium]